MVLAVPAPVPWQGLTWWMLPAVQVAPGGWEQAAPGLLSSPGHGRAPGPAQGSS